MSFRSVLTHTTLALFVANQSVAALGQGPRQLADKPLGIMYAKDINERSMVNYVAGISERMGVGKTLSERIGEQFEKIVTTKAQTPVIGQLFYLVKGLVPSMETISFQSVIDESEARKLIESRKEMMGGEATLEEGLNGHYKLVRTWEHESELKPEQEVKEYSTEQAGRSNKLEIIERDGKRFQKRTGSYTQQYRYHDQFLYSNQAEDFTTVQLPSSQDIFDNLDDDNDVGVKFFADRVPQGLRSLGWTMLSAGMGTQLQQRDGEGEESWQVRQSAGNWGLATGGWHSSSR